MPYSDTIILRGHVWLVATFIPLLTRLLPLGRLLRLLTPSGRFTPYRNVQPERLIRIIRNRLNNPRNMRRRACLREGLMLFYFLKLAGAPAVIHIGLHPPDERPRLHGHCWVSLNGQAVSEPMASPSVTLLTHS